MWVPNERGFQATGTLRGWRDLPWEQCGYSIRARGDASVRGRVGEEHAFPLYSCGLSVR
jgi:hypothetical protein